MYYTLSKRISNRLINKGVISSDEEEVCTYGLFMLFSHISLFIVTLIFGLILKRPLESILFYIQFQVIRRYGGGYHASVEWRCNVLSALSMFACVWLTKMIDINKTLIALLIISAISAGMIVWLCPVDTKEKPLSETEYQRFRRITIVVLLFYIAAIVILTVLGQKYWIIPSCLSIILESILLVAGKVKNSIIARKMDKNRASAFEVNN